MPQIPHFFRHTGTRPLNNYRAHDLKAFAMKNAASVIPYKQQMVSLLG
jgi:hypothetical protein